MRVSWNPCRIRSTDMAHTVLNVDRIHMDENIAHVTPARRGIDMIVAQDVLADDTAAHKCQVAKLGYTIQLHNSGALS